MTAAERIRLARENRPFGGLCLCPDDCSCHYQWRATLCGCRAHDEAPCEASAASVRSSVERGDAFAILRTSTELEGS